MECRLGPDVRIVQNTCFALNNMAMKRILYMRFAAEVALAIDAFTIGFIIGEDRYATGRCQKMPKPQLVMHRQAHDWPDGAVIRHEHGMAIVILRQTDQRFGRGW